MTVYHDFLFVDEKNDVVIKEINLDDIFIDFVREDIDCKNDLYNLIPTINPNYVKKPYGNIKPKIKGLDYAGISVINHYGFDSLVNMFSEWINILEEKLSCEYYYPDLVVLTNEELDSLSDYELEELKEIFFVKSEIMKKMKLCMKYLESLNSSDFVVYYQGI